MPWQHTRGSALLGWVKDDAQHIADEIATLANTVTSPAAPELAADPAAAMSTATAAPTRGR